MEDRLAETPQLVIVGGPNGSGKTTLALECADELALPYIGADAIAVALNPLDPAAVHTAAAREFIRSIEKHISQKNSFVCESTLSGLTMQGQVLRPSFSIRTCFRLSQHMDENASACYIGRDRTQR